jgi:hypothetical protein
MDWKRTTLLAGAMVIAAGVLSGCGAIYKTRPNDLTEARACAGVAPETAARADVPGASVTTVDAIQERPLVPGGRASPGYIPVYLRGARLTLRGEAGPRDIERLLACRIARFAAAGDDGVDPVAVRGASARVRPGEEGSVVVELRAADETAAAEVLRRARALASR